ITGAGSGIGRASALLFAREGGCVVVADVERDGADETVAQITAAGGDASAFVIDVTDPAAAKRLADHAASTHGRVDVLFNNAGISVNALIPGTIHTPFVEKYLRESYPNREDGLKEIRKRQLTAELGKPEDVASAALFLASDESRFVMGSALFVDGGVRGGK